MNNTTISLISRNKAAELSLELTKIRRDLADMDTLEQEALSPFRERLDDIKEYWDKEKEPLRRRKDIVCDLLMQYILAHGECPTSPEGERAHYIRHIPVATEITDQKALLERYSHTQEVKELLLKLATKELRTSKRENGKKVLTQVPGVEISFKMAVV